MPEAMPEEMTEDMTDSSAAAIRDGPFSETWLATSMAPKLQSATAHSRRPGSLLLWLPRGNPRRPILGDLARYFYGSQAAIRDGPFSESWLAASMAPQLQSGTAHSRRPGSLRLWLPSCNPRRPILGYFARYLYGSPAAIRDGPFSETWLATSMAPQLNPRRPILGDLARYCYGSPGEENDDGDDFFGRAEGRRR